MKAQALADYLVENPVDDEYEPLKTYFPDEEVMCVDEVDHDEKPGWKLFFDGAANMKEVGIGVVLISETGQHYPVTAQLRFYCTNNMAEYEACILGLRLAIDMGVQEILVLGDLDLLVYQIQGEWETRDLKFIPYWKCLHDFCQRFRLVEFRHIPRIHNEIADALATLASMLHHPDKAYVDPVHIQPFVAWGMDVIGPIEPAVSSGHRFILVAIDYFTKWIEAVIITDNATNLNSHLMKEVCQQFKIMHWNSTPCRPKANGAVEAANKNIKKILRKMVQEVEITSLRIVAEAGIDDDEWVKTRLEQLSLIDEKKLAVICHGQLYQKRMAYNKKVRPQKFEVGQMVLKRILPHQVEAKGKFAPNWQGPFVVTRVLPNGTLYLTDIEGKCVDMAINSDAVKRRPPGEQGNSFQTYFNLQI
ncbi:uncharacterized protein [Nicotiana sylvestris]|uniref:uncharacterized protein n=1 Tax=Nicotiana sylvestris TaxID=4096 RepID=UPI00388C4F65